jgi:MoaA/NifB/PqqE/SkfB family radical SAM enzyme
MKKYCVLPFISVRIEDNKNLNSMGFRPCCFYRDTDLPTFTNIDDYLNSDFLKNLQQHLLTQDNLPPGCNSCSTIESKKQVSVRQLKNKFFQDLVLQQTAIQELDIFPSNTCNLTCVMCSPKFSSSVAAEQKKLGWITDIYNFDETDLILDSLKQLSHLQYIHIAGGEFFYSKHCLKILEAIESAKIPNVEFITNGTICNDQHISILKTFENLSLRFSIDGIDDHYEFIRYPAKWTDVKTNILNYKNQLPNAHLELVMVVQPLNIFNILKWTQWANDNNIETHWQLISGDMGWGAITAEEKQLATDFIFSNYKKIKLDQKQLVTILNYAKNTIPNLPFTSQERDQFISKLVRLCKHRKLTPDAVTKLLGPWKELQGLITLQLS